MNVVKDACSSLLNRGFSKLRQEYMDSALHALHSYDEVYEPKQTFFISRENKDLLLRTGDFLNWGRSFWWVSTYQRIVGWKRPIISFRIFIRGSGKNLKICTYARIRMNTYAYEPTARSRKKWLAWLRTIHKRKHLKNSLGRLLSYTEHFCIRFGERYTSHLLY